MNNLNKKQKIILGILTAIVAGAICYYVYAKQEQASTEQVDLENSVETREYSEKHGNTEDDTKNENYSDTVLIVHVSGAVNKEDVYEFKPGSRVSDAIEKAGGLKEEADLSDINLAYKLEDGMKIHIPTKQEKKEETKISENLNKNQVSKPEGKNKVNINTATQTELETLSGIGSSTALKIIQYRKEKGKFKKIEEIKEISGIGESKYEKIKNNITI